MRRAEQEGLEEKAAAEKIIAETPLFRGIESIRVELGHDHTGDPALWLMIQRGRDATSDDAWFRDLNEYIFELSQKIGEAGVTRFPYTRLFSYGQLKPAA